MVWHLVTSFGIRHFHYMGLLILPVLKILPSVKEAPTSYIKHCKVKGTASA